MINVDAIKFVGVFKLQLFRAGRIIYEETVRNLVTTEGKNKIFDVMFHGVAAIATWYIGLIDNSGFSAVAAADTMASHAGWTELTSYSQANRVEWTEGSASGGSITNAVAITFSMNATAGVRGIFVTSSNVKGGVAGTLWAATIFGVNVPVSNGDTVKITYTVSA